MSKVLLVTGPAGAGKTTTCEAFAKTAEGVWAFISQDKIRQFIKAGFKNPSHAWTDETQAQWDVSIDICADIAKRYQGKGINCVIDCFAPQGSFDKWEPAFTGVEYKIVVLLPSVKEAIKRNNQRTGDAKLKESQIHEHHEWHSMWDRDKRATIIDTTSLSLDHVVEAIGELI